MKFATITIVLIALLNLLPNLFNEGQVFDVTAIVENECGKRIVEHGIYLDNVYYTLFELLTMFLPFALPFVFKLPRWFNWVCLVFAGWGLAGFVTEVMNLREPLVVYNSSEGTQQYIWWVTLIVSSIGFIILNENIKILNER